MKRILTLILITVGITARSQSPSTGLLDILTFSGLSSHIKPGYGSLKDPIPSGAFKYVADKNKMQLQMLKLKNSYRWPGGQRLDFSSRFSTRNSSGTGVVDCYTLVKPGTTDTIRLFVDPYNEAPAYDVPEGLIALTAPILQIELAPYIKQVEELNSAPDPSILKETSMQILGFINKNIGLAAFMDSDILKEISTDKEADPELTGYLLRSYIFHKFYAYAKNLGDPKKYAAGKLKNTFEKFSTIHPEVKAGNLKTALNNY